MMTETHMQSRGDPPPPRQRVIPVGFPMLLQA